MDDTAVPITWRPERLVGRVILVTGAGRGLGAAIARRIAAYGARVIAIARSSDELATVAESIAGAGGQVETSGVDLARPEQIGRLASHIAATYGGLDALVNNAAILRARRFLDLDAEDFEATIAVNLLAPVRLTRAVLPGMLARGRGSIVNVSSAAGVQPFLDETDYCAAKYGLEGFSRSLALELRADGQNVAVNLVTPGRSIKPTSVTAAEFAGWPAERRAAYADPGELADAVAFLCLQDGGGISGERFSAWNLAQRLRTVDRVDG